MLPTPRPTLFCAFVHPSFQCFHIPASWTIDRRVRPPHSTALLFSSVAIRLRAYPDPSPVSLLPVARCHLLAASSCCSSSAVRCSVPSIRVPPDCPMPDCPTAVPPCVRVCASSTLPAHPVVVPAHCTPPHHHAPRSTRSEGITRIYIHTSTHTSTSTSTQTSVYTLSRLVLVRHRSRPHVYHQTAPRRRATEHCYTCRSRPPSFSLIHTLSFPLSLFISLFFSARLSPSSSHPVSSTRHSCTPTHPRTPLLCVSTRPPRRTLGTLGMLVPLALPSFSPSFFLLEAQAARSSVSRWASPDTCTCILCTTPRDAAVAVCVCPRALRLFRTIDVYHHPRFRSSVQIS